MSSLSSEEEMAVARLNDTYDLIRIIGRGSTCKVWLARHVDQPSFQFAIKIMSSQYMKMKNAINNISKEVHILRQMSHEGIVKMYEYGDDGVISCNNQVVHNKVYIVMEYVQGPLLFDICKENGSMGEDVGLYFANQLIQQLEYMNSKNVVHRDVKLENILLDERMNLKLADFGFATNRNIDKLNTFRGTQSYMAPEIRESKEYDGRQTDVFSLGVVLFTIVVGYFPFSKAEFSDQFYNFLQTGQQDDQGINNAYWATLKATHISTEFKDLMHSIFSYDPELRPTV